MPESPRTQILQAECSSNKSASRCRGHLARRCLDEVSLGVGGSILDSVVVPGSTQGARFVARSGTLFWFEWIWVSCGTARRFVTLRVREFLEYAMVVLKFARAPGLRRVMNALRNWQIWRQNTPRQFLFGTHQPISLVSTSSLPTNVAPQWREASGHSWIGSDANWVERFLPILRSWHRSGYTRYGSCRLQLMRCHQVFSLRSRTFQTIPRVRSQCLVGSLCFWLWLVCVGGTKPDRLFSI